MPKGKVTCSEDSFLITFMFVFTTSKIWHRTVVKIKLVNIYIYIYIYIYISYLYCIYIANIY